jgi:hypothetical protein
MSSSRSRTPSSLMSHCSAGEDRWVGGVVVAGGDGGGVGIRPLGLQAEAAPACVQLLARA